MTTRSQIIITALVLCHLLLASRIVTSQTPPLPSSSASQSHEEVTIRATEQEKTGSVYHLRGNARIDYRTYILQADEIT